MTAPALSRYAAGKRRTGQTRSVAGRTSTSSSAAGTISQPSHDQALAGSPHGAVSARPHKAPSRATVTAPSAWTVCAIARGSRGSAPAITAAWAAAASGQAHQPPSANGLASITPSSSAVRNSSGAWAIVGQAIARQSRFAASHAYSAAMALTATSPAASASRPGTKLSISIAAVATSQSVASTISTGWHASSPIASAARERWTKNAAASEAAAAIRPLKR